MIDRYACFFCVLSMCFPLWVQGGEPSKALICGVCRNVEFAVQNTIGNIEELGSRFEDYAVIIYENNSHDATAALLAAWAEANPKVKFVSETVPALALPPSREQGIARARNKVLSIAKERGYEGFTFLVMVDLDFTAPWPIDEIVATTKVEGEWDCISANGVFNGGTLYWDRYAFRDKEHPLGPEVLGNEWWDRLEESWFGMADNGLVPVYSAFGGLAVYKRETLIKFRYSGTVTKDLQKYYGKILQEADPSNHDLCKYLKLNKKKYPKGRTEKVVIRSQPPSTTFGIYKHTVCCEHVALHASMALHGHGKFFINPKLLMIYSHCLAD